MSRFFPVSDVHLLRKRLFMAALLILLASNVIVLGKVAYNRMNIVKAISLSEREIYNSYSNFLDNEGRENSGITLDLRWRTPVDVKQGSYYNYGTQLSMSQQDFDALGFERKDCATFQYQMESETKPAWVMLELNGQSYQNDQVLLDSHINQVKAEGDKDNQLDMLRDVRKNLLDTDSRLYAIAVAIDPKRLLPMLQGHDERFLVKGMIHDDIYCEYKVDINELFLSSLYVPKNLLQGVTQMPAKYSVNMAIGNLGEAWITAFTPDNTPQIPQPQPGPEPESEPQPQPQPSQEALEETRP